MFLVRNYKLGAKITSSDSDKQAQISCSLNPAELLS